MLGVPGVISPASATCRQGRALSKTSAASSGVLTGSTGPSQTARRDAASPTAKKGDRPRASRMTQLLATLSGQMPAGSHSDTDKGGISAGSAERKSGWYGKGVVGSVHLGGRRILTKKNHPEDKNKK